MRTDLTSHKTKAPPKRMTHLADGSARMVDVGEKPSKRRVAVAEAWVEVGPAVARMVRQQGAVRKGMCWKRRDSPGSWPRNARPS